MSKNIHTLLVFLQMTYFKKNTVLRDHPWYNMGQNFLSFNPNNISLVYILNVLLFFSWTLGCCLIVDHAAVNSYLRDPPCLRASAVCTQPTPKIKGRIPIAHSSYAILRSHRCCINVPLPTSAPILANAPFLGGSHPKGVRYDVVWQF